LKAKAEEYVITTKIANSKYIVNLRRYNRIPSIHGRGGLMSLVAHDSQDVYLNNQVNKLQSEVNKLQSDLGNISKTH
jgi:hypothetical protein